MNNNMQHISQALKPTAAKSELLPMRQLSPTLQRKTTAVLAKYGTRENFLQVLNPSTQVLAARNPERAFFGKAPTLGVLKKTYGENAATMWLLPQLYDLCEYTGAKKMDAQQATMLAEVIAQEYGFLKVSELLMFFFRFKAGAYGRFYGAVDPLVITSALKEFMREREWAYQQHEAELQEQERKEQDKIPRSTWEEYAAKRGITSPNPLEILTSKK